MAVSPSLNFDEAPDHSNYKYSGNSTTSIKTKKCNA